MLLAIVMLMVVPNTTKARSYCPVRYRVRWSPYVHGLISGDVYYSPYAFRHGHSGLVCGDVRYSPYAFSCEHPSGLINDYGCCCRPSNMIYVTNWELSRVSTQPTQSFEEMKKDYQEKVGARKARIESLKDSRKEINTAREKDGCWIIFNYLKSKNITFKIRNRLSAQNKTLCCEFLLGDGSLLIKYRNPEAIKQAKKNPRYNGFYQKYKEDWTEFCKGYTGKIYEMDFAS